MSEIAKQNEGSENSNSLLERMMQWENSGEYKKLQEQLTFNQYYKIVEKNPDVARTAYQRMYDMIVSHGVEEIKEGNEEMRIYKFFEDSFGDGIDAIFGIDRHLSKLVDLFKAAAEGYGVEKRVLLLHGPVGSSKSTIARLLKRGLEAYSRTDEGMLYTFGWKSNGFEGRELAEDCPMHEDPLHLLPRELRQELRQELLKDEKGRYPLSVEGSLCPSCRFEFKDRRGKHSGSIGKVLEDVVVRRLILSEEDRIGIGTFQPKDEKNQDSTELTGDINYRKIAEIGSDSDPRAFNFDGELNIANRGMVELIEVLKLDVAFLYELLGASQEHVIKPKKFPHVFVDEVLLAHTNEPEYKKLQNNEFMEALRDRTVKIDIPYVTVLSDEVKIYEKYYGKDRVRGKHIAPHVLEMASMWSILTRLEEPKDGNLSLLQKLKLYDGRTIPGFTDDHVREFRETAKREGMDGISPRYIQDKISNAAVAHSNEKCINPFMVLTELKEGLKHHSLITSDDQRKHFGELISVVEEEYENIVKNEVQRAIAADEDALSRLCGNYVDNIRAYTQKEKVRNKFTGQLENPDEKLMRSIEDKIEIPEGRKDDFRQQIMNFIGARALDGKTFDFRSNERLMKALELKLFEDQKDSIKLSSLVSGVVDRETQGKIDIVKARMIRDYGYCESCAPNILQYVASIFARGDSKK